jgi:hypothetical protein
VYKLTGPPPVPIQLAAFTAQRVANARVQLNWRTISETNNFGFFVQRKLDNDDFVELSNIFIAGHGTTLEPQHYSFIDSTSPNAVLSYRLRQVDLDGSSHFTDPVSVSVTTSATENRASVFSLEQNYPNPFNPTTQIGFGVRGSGFVSLKVFDVLGNEVATLVDGFLSAGNYSRTFDASQLASGVYFYRLSAGSFVATKKLVIMR